MNHAFSNLEEAIHRAIEQCIKENVLRDFLIEHRAEVTHMMTLDFTFERRLELQREEAREEGIKIGREAGKREGEQLGREAGKREGERLGREAGIKEALSGLIRNKMVNKKSLEQIADDLDVPVDQIRPIYEEIAKELQK